MNLTIDPTPCGVLFDLLKRHGKMTHGELAGYILSGRPLSDGRSPLDRARDRTWLSHCIVHAPVGTLQERYFADWGTAASHVVARLGMGRAGRRLDPDGLIEVLCGGPGRAMDRALRRCHQDAQLFRNALERLAHEGGKSPSERAEAALALFMAAACTADVRQSVSYAMGFAERGLGHRVATPAVGELRAHGSHAAPETVLGLIRVEGEYVAGGPHWLAPGGCVVGALATGEGDVTDVGAGVSARHLRAWREEPAAEKDARPGSPDRGRWLVEDFGSTNGTVLVSGADGSRSELVPGRPAVLLPGDRLVLAGTTVLVAVEGLAGPR